MSDPEKGQPHNLWAHLRFSVVGPLLAAPPPQGQLQAELDRLAAKQWRHPITGELTLFGLSTIQRWYYAARAEKMDPVAVLRRKVRVDAGKQPSLSGQVRQLLEAQYRNHKGWSYQLHHDNLRVLIQDQPNAGPMPSYSSLLRYMNSHDMVHRSRPRGRFTPGMERAQRRLETLEVRSYEAEYVSGLWHLDFHHGSLKIMTEAAEWVTPLLLAVMDDQSRLVCHAQWYLTETAEDLCHGLSQAFLKRGLPRALMTDGGTAMKAAETRQGLQRLGILHEQTLPYSPYQNGKQEAYWGQVEGRLLAMLENHRELTLAWLNQVTQAWIEMEYHRTIHSETGETPLRRFLDGKSVGRACPSADDLRLAFCQETQRRQRRSDGTISLSGIRFEIPSRFRHLRRVDVRYAFWDLGHVYLADARADKVIARLFPLDRARNADGLRRSLAKIDDGTDNARAAEPQDGMAPLLRKLLQEYAATGLPPAYLPKTNPEEES